MIVSHENRIVLLYSFGSTAPRCRALTGGRITMKKHLITTLCAFAAVAAIAGAASAVEPPGRPAVKIADVASECNPQLNGRWACLTPGATKRHIRTITLKPNGNGGMTLKSVRGWANLGEGARMTIDERVHTGSGGLRYAASCNHRSRGHGYKILRIATEYPTQSYFSDYIVFEGGKWLYIASYDKIKMDGLDVVNSATAGKPYRVTKCFRTVK